MWDINHELCTGKGLSSSENLGEGPSCSVVWPQPREGALLGCPDGLKLQGLHSLLQRGGAHSTFSSGQDETFTLVSVTYVSKTLMLDILAFTGVYHLCKTAT